MVLQIFGVTMDDISKLIEEEKIDTSNLEEYATPKYHLSEKMISSARKWYLENRWTIGGYFLPGAFGAIHGLHNLMSSQNNDGILSGGLEVYLGTCLMAIAIQYRTRHKKRFEDIKTELLTLKKEDLNQEELLAFTEQYMVAPPCVRSTMRCVLESFFENGRELWHDVVKERYKPIPAYVQAGINSMKN